MCEREVRYETWATCNWTAIQDIGSFWLLRFKACMEKTKPRCDMSWTILELECVQTKDLQGNLKSQFSPDLPAPDQTKKVWVQETFIL